MTKSPAPPAPVSSASATSSPTDDAARNNVIPSEVGWQFVPQYYTFVNKHPHRLHCFYTKSSTFIHGTEGEDGKPCFGQLVSPARAPFFLRIWLRSCVARLGAQRAGACVARVVSWRWRRIIMGAASTDTCRPRGR